MTCPVKFISIVLPHPWRTLSAAGNSLLLSDMPYVDTSKQLYHHADADVILYQTSEGEPWAAGDASASVVDETAFGTSPTAALRALAALAKQLDDEEGDHIADVCAEAADALDGPDYEH